MLQGLGCCRVLCRTDPPGPGPGWRRLVSRPARCHSPLCSVWCELTHPSPITHHLSPIHSLIAQAPPAFCYNVWIVFCKTDPYCYCTLYPQSGQLFMCGMNQNLLNLSVPILMVNSKYVQFLPLDSRDITQSQCHNVTDTLTDSQSPMPVPWLPKT